MSFDLTNKNISDTFQNLLQKTGSDGKLYNLQGEEVRDLTIPGTLTAHSYVTSESIVNTSSGSTAFGNSVDDIHIFSGSLKGDDQLKILGDISASGDLYVGGNDIKDSGNNTVLSFDGSGHLNPKTTNGTILNLEGTTIYSNPMMEMKMTGLSPQSPWIKFWGSVSPGFAVGMDAGSSPTTFKIIPGIQITDNDGIVFDYTGKVGINTNPITGIELTVAGDISGSNNFTLGGSGSFGGANSSSAALTVEGSVSASGAMIHTVKAFADGDGTPDVSNGYMFKTANTSTQNITTFDGGEAGQEILIFVNDGNTRFVDGTNLHLRKNADWTTAAAGDIIKFITPDGTGWYEIVKCDNS